MIYTKETLIDELKKLAKTHKIKQTQYQLENNLSEECGCITRESCKIAMLTVEMLNLGVTFNDINENE